MSIGTNSVFNTYPFNNKLLGMSKIIEGIFFKYGILVSSIYIHEYPKNYIIHFNIFISHHIQYFILKNIIKLIKSLLVLKYNKNISFNIHISKSIYYDNKFISSWLSYKLQNDPLQLRFITKKLWKFINKKNVNKTKNRR